MKYLWSGFLTSLSLRLRSLRGWAILLLLPLLTFCACQLLPPQEVSAPVRVGVALPEDGGESFWTLLEQRSGTVITFIKSDENTIEKMVATSQWDCGLILSEDFEEAIQTVDTDRLFTLRIGAGSVAYPLVRETVAACVAELIKAPVAREYLLDSGIVQSEELMEELEPVLNEILPDSARVAVEMRTLDEKPLNALDLADDGVERVLRWLVSAVLLVWLLLCAVELGEWMASPQVRRMRGVQPDTVLMLSRVGADMVLAAAAGCLSLLMLGDGLAGCTAVVGYVLFWGMMAVLFGHFRVIWSALPVMIPFIPVVSLLLSSAIVDIGLVVPALENGSSFIPASLFLTVCEGDIGKMPILLAMACACLAASCLKDRRM